MGENGVQAGNLDVTPEGWIVTDLEMFRMLADHAPPRPYGYRDQLKADARSWQCIALWLTGLAVIVAAAATRLWYLALVGGWLFFRWSRMMRNTVRMIRDYPLAVGVVETLQQRHPLVRDCSIANVRLGSGRVVVVTVPTQPVATLLEKQEKVEVMFPHDAGDPYAVAFGVRPCK